VRFVVGAVSLCEIKSHDGRPVVVVVAIVVRTARELPHTSDDLISMAVCTFVVLSVQPIGMYGCRGINDE
jgi:hypothetical protein